MCPRKKMQDEVSSGAANLVTSLWLDSNKFLLELRQRDELMMCGIEAMNK
jgi:hypothetical protein